MPGTFAPARRAGSRALTLVLACALAAGCGHGAGPGAPEAARRDAGGGPVLSGFVAFGDFGGGDGQLAVARAMTRWASAHRVDALVTTGDNVYQAGEPFHYRAQLDLPYRELRRGRPLWAALGNHDVAAGHARAELRHLGLPPPPSVERLPGVQLLFLDANHPDAAQAAWLGRQLAAPGPPLRVVVFHQPAWSCGAHGSTGAVDRLWVPLLERYHAALVLNGHDHDYERFRSAGGVTYVVTGGGGQTLYPLLPFCSAAPMRQAAAVRHHFVGVEVRAASLTLTTVADDGTVLDRAVIRA